MTGTAQGKNTRPDLGTVDEAYESGCVDALREAVRLLRRSGDRETALAQLEELVEELGREVLVWPYEHSHRQAAALRATNRRPDTNPMKEDG